jgi:hypothetical protein
MCTARLAQGVARALQMEERAGEFAGVSVTSAKEDRLGDHAVATASIEGCGTVLAAG